MLGTTVLAAPAGDNYSDIWLVKTKGFTTQHGGVGFYRVIVYRIPTKEDSYDQVVIEIISQNDSLEKKVTNKIKTSIPGYKGYIADISFKELEDNKTAIIFDIEMKGMDGIVLKEIALISPDGKFKVVKEAKYVDIYQ